MTTLTVLLRRRLGWLFAALALMILLIGVVTMQQMMVIVAQDKALAISEVVKAGLTAHMKNGIMDRRDYFLNEIKSLHNIRELAIIRSEAVNRQFGAGGQEKEIDHISREVFGQKRPRYLFDNLLLSSSPTIQAYIPYIASDEGALNCLMCHQVTKGEVLGVVAITLDLSDYYTIGIGALELQAAALFIVLIVGALWLATTLRRHVMVPLRRLQANLREAFEEKKPIDVDGYKTQEFREAALDSQMLVMEIRAKQEEIEEINKKLSTLNDEIETTLRETVKMLGEIGESRSTETKHHLGVVAAISVILARKLGWSDEQIEELEYASYLHDLGKIGIPDAILEKPGRLSDEEYRIMTTHTTIGWELLKNSQRPLLRQAAVIAKYHHERWDGRGYPEGLAGEEIPLVARLVGIADVIDALCSRRCYKEAWPAVKVRAFFEEERGRQFDPKLTDVVLEHFEEIMAARDAAIAER